MDHPSAEELFCELIDLPVDERGAALDAMAPEGSALRSELLRLLKYAEAADAYFTGTAVAVKMLPSQGVAPAPIEADGDMVGPYRLVCKLGSGGFGVVWLAEQTKPLRRTVALKVLKAGMDSAEVLARFDAEKQALARMDHPHIAKVLDAGMTDTGRSYFAMELVDGFPLNRYCEEHSLSTRERLQLFMDVCSAVNHAHQKGVIHRDLKPSNILVSRQDSGPVAKVIDFGIAKAIEGDLTDKTLHTRAEQWIGTPVYMSPEQLGVESADLDTRSDIYALGVILYELIAGSPPFDSETLMRAGYEEMRRIIREQDPPRPSARITTQRNSQTGGPGLKTNIATGKALKSIQSELDWIVMKAIEKSKDRRYDSAAALADDLGRFLKDEPVSAKPPSTSYLVAKFVRRHRNAVVISILFVIILASAAVFSFWQASEARDARDLAKENLQAVLRERNAKDAALKDAEAISRVFSDVIRRPSPEIDGRTVTVVQALDGTLQKLNADYKGDPRRHAMLLQVLADTYENLGLMEQSIEIRRKALEILSSLGETSMLESLDSAEAIVSRLGHVGRYGEAAQLAGEVFVQRDIHFGPSDPATIRILDALALNTFRAGNYQQAIDLQEKLVRRMEESGVQNNPLVGEAYATLMEFCKDSGDIERMGKLSLELREINSTSRRISNRESAAVNTGDELGKKRIILEQLEHDVGKASTKTIAARMELASILTRLGNKKEAVASHVEVVEQCKETYGEFHPKTLDAIDKCIDACNLFSEWGIAHQMRQNAAEIRKAAHGLNHYESLCFHGDRMFALSLINRAEEGLKLGEEFLPQIRVVMGPQSRSYYHYSCNYARCLSVSGRSKESIDVLAVACPNMSDDTYVNLLLATQLLWARRTQEYEELRDRMLGFWKMYRDRESRYTYQLERNAFLCTLLPIRNEEQRREIAATLAKVEAILRSPEYQRHEYHGPSFSKAIQGVLHYRLGNFESAIQRFDEALRIAEGPQYDDMDLVRMLDAIFRPLALHGLGHDREAKQIFEEKAGAVRLWKNAEEPLVGYRGTDGMEIAIFLAYKEAAKILGITVSNHGEGQRGN